MFFAGCICDLLAIVIYNSNAARDDNFKVLLNGTEIGQIDNNQHALTGRIFSQNGTITPSNIGTPSTNVFETTITLNMALLVAGTNTIRVESIQDNNNGNAGIIRVGYYKLDEATVGKYDVHTSLLEAIYNHADGVGNFTEVNFTYP